jgi:hypothetical protein
VDIIVPDRLEKKLLVIHITVQLIVSMKPGETSLLAQKHVMEELSSEQEVSKQLLHLEELNAPETQKKNNLATLKTAQLTAYGTILVIGIHAV